MNTRATLSRCSPLSPPPDQLHPTHIAAEMPYKKATEAISQIKADNSKVLGLRIGSHDVQLDQHIPVKGWCTRPTYNIDNPEY